MKNQKAVETGPRRGTITEVPVGDTLYPGLSVTLYATVDGFGEGRVYGYGMELKHRKLAERLVKAWEAKAFAKHLTLNAYAPGVRVNDKDFYISYDSKGSDYCPLGRTLNADLKRLGF